MSIHGGFTGESLRHPIFDPCKWQSSRIFIDPAAGSFGLPETSWSVSKFLHASICRRCWTGIQVRLSCPPCTHMKHHAVITTWLSVWWWDWISYGKRWNWRQLQFLVHTHPADPVVYHTQQILRSNPWFSPSRLGCLACAAKQLALEITENSFAHTERGLVSVTWRKELSQQ